MLLIVTRPAAQAAAWVRQLQALGWAAQPLPLIDIGPAADAAPVRRAWDALAGHALVMFVSANAVEQFFALAPGAPGTPAAWPVATLAGSTGAGTSAALRAAGVPAAALAEPAADATSFDSEALWARIGERDWAGRRVLIVRGEEGRDWLADRLRQRGAQVDFVAAYRRGVPVPDAAGNALLAAARSRPAQHVWLFSSSEAVANLQAIAPDADWSRSTALASHPRIAAAARDAGYGRVDIVLPAPAAVAAWLASSAAEQPAAGEAPIQSAPP